LKEGLESQDVKKFKDVYGERLFNDFQSAFGENLECKFSADLLSLAKNIHDEPIKPKIYSACGTEDFLREENKRFNEEMKKLNFQFTYEEWTGNHNFYFFDEALKRGLEFLYKK
jgi:S-formylglutathione hydrolase FrmB